MSSADDTSRSAAGAPASAPPLTGHDLRGPHPMHDNLARRAILTAVVPSGRDCRAPPTGGRPAPRQYRATCRLIAGAV